MSMDESTEYKTISKKLLKEIETTKNKAIENMGRMKKKEKRTLNPDTCEIRPPLTNCYDTEEWMTPEILSE